MLANRRRIKKGGRSRSRAVADMCTGMGAGTAVIGGARSIVSVSDGDVLLASSSVLGVAWATPLPSLHDVLVVEAKNEGAIFEAPPSVFEKTIAFDASPEWWSASRHAWLELSSLLVVSARFRPCA